MKKMLFLSISLAACSLVAMPVNIRTIGGGHVVVDIDPSETIQDLIDRGVSEINEKGHYEFHKYTAPRITVLKNKEKERLDAIPTQTIAQAGIKAGDNVHFILRAPGLEKIPVHIVTLDGYRTTIHVSPIISIRELKKIGVRALKHTYPALTEYTPKRVKVVAHQKPIDEHLSQSINQVGIQADSTVHFVLKAHSHR